MGESEEELIKRLEKEQSQDKKDNFLKRIWSKTVFPDMIKARREEKTWLRDVRTEAKKKARVKYKEDIVNDIAQEELDKMKGKKKSKITGALKKIGDEFAGVGKNIGADDKISKMLGTGVGSNTGGGLLGGGNVDVGKLLGTEKQPQNINTETKTKKKKGKKKKKEKEIEEKQEENKIDNFEDKIKRMLS